MTVFGRLFKARDKPCASLNGSGYSFFFGNTASGKAVNERSAMQMSAVYACVRILAEAVASLPLHFYRYNEAGGKEKALGHPLYNLRHDEPNPEMSAFSFRETLMTHLLLWGNAYAQVIRNGRGEVAALYPLMPDRMTVDRDSAGRIFYEYLRADSDARTLGRKSVVRLAPEDVFHIPGLGFDGLVRAAIDRELSQPVGRPLTERPEPSADRSKTGTATDEYKAAFWRIMRVKSVPHEVLNALQVGVESEGGYLAPDEYQRTLIEALEGQNIFRQLAHVISTSSGDRKIPVVASKGTASWIDEEAAYPESDDSFGQVSIGAYKLATMPRCRRNYYSLRAPYRRNAVHAGGRWAVNCLSHNKTRLLVFRRALSLPL